MSCYLPTCTGFWHPPEWICYHRICHLSNTIANKDQVYFQHMMWLDLGPGTARGGRAGRCLNYSFADTARLPSGFPQGPLLRLSLFVSGFPDFVSSGGGIGGAGTTKEDETCSARSTSGSGKERGLSRSNSPKVKYGEKGTSF